MKLRPVTLPRVLPEAHCRVHDAPCGPCPSAHYPPDPESEDIRLNWSRPDQLAVLFVCAWRPTALCRGQYDDLAVTREELAAREVSE